MLDGFLRSRVCEDALDGQINFDEEAFGVANHLAWLRSASGPFANALPVTLKPFLVGDGRGHGLHDPGGAE